MSFNVKPEVTLQNQAEVYKYYTNHIVNPLLTMAGQAIMRLGVHSRIHMLPTTGDDIRGHLQNHGQILYAVNHVSNVDPFVFSAMQVAVKDLHPTRPNTSALAKTALFPSPVASKPLTYTNPIARWGIEVMRSVPTYRASDYMDDKGIVSTQDRVLLTSAGQNLLSLIMGRLKKGDHIGMFPEGSRNKKDPRTLQPLERGVGLIAAKGYKVTDGQLAILPVGQFYGNSRTRPHVVVGDIIKLDGLKPKDVLEVLPVAMQGCVDIAAMYYDSAHSPQK